jgi:hypothetical protein
MKRIILLFSFSLGACGPDPGIGKSCDISACGINAPPDNGNVVCEPAIECKTLICVAQGNGLFTGESTQFCTADCAEDSDCPENFSCVVVAGIGENADRKMCLIK